MKKLTAVAALFVYCSFSVLLSGQVPQKSRTKRVPSGQSGTNDNRKHKPSDAYLFAYFTDKNDNKNGMHLAYSFDGYTWTGIGNEHSFLRSDCGETDVEKRMRDPFLMKGHDGRWHCIWTTGWNTSTIGYSSSEDLLTWNTPRCISVMTGYEPRNCWAPEMIYDEHKKRYIIYWASTIKVNGKWKTEKGREYDNRMYYTTTKDFKTFDAPKIFFDPGHNVIDATIQKIGDKYYMIYKDETEIPKNHKNLLVAISDRPEGPYVPSGEKPFTKDWVEGPAFCALPDNSFLIYMDAYTDRKYEAKRTKDFIKWEDVTDRISVPADLKHGSIVKVPLDLIDTILSKIVDEKIK